LGDDDASCTMIDVMQELKAVGAKYQSGDLRGGLSLLQDLWGRIPEPRSDTPNAYMAVEYGVAFALKVRDVEEAWLWANRAPEFREKRQDRGEVEFLIGKVAYEAGMLDVARERFQEANLKSRGRIFSSEDPKYAALLKS
jgi:hypothetical protein